MLHLRPPRQERIHKLVWPQDLAATRANPFSLCHPEAASFDSQNVFFEMYCPQGLPLHLFLTVKLEM